jgi:hypothetical protein
MMFDRIRRGACAAMMPMARDVGVPIGPRAQ